jgi:hypothetical protein
MSEDELYDDNEFEYGFFDVDKDDSASEDDSDYAGDKDDDDKDDYDKDDDGTSKKTRGKGRDWTYVRTFGADSIEAEKEAKKSTFSTYRTVPGRFEYKCKSNGCMCLVRFVKKSTRSTVFWNVSMHGHHEHQSDNDNEPWISESENYTNDVGSRGEAAGP